jgi:2-polyprenyl-3-methyl-5-hydroxy-6-metoxy-1,4-benzoquinol methylase
VASVQDADNINYQNEFFDAVICMEYLEHAKDVVKTVDEISRILKDGGLVIVTVPYMKNCDCDEHVRWFDEVKLWSVFSGDFELVNLFKIPYLNWTYNDNLFLIARKRRG